VKSTGTVYLVGAGPGDAGLLTLRGAELLRRAEVVISDVLVNPELFRFAPPGAEIIHRGNQKRDGGLSQEELTGLMLDRARAGKTVVRLKGGDPYIFGRGGEEAQELAAAKIPFEVVPGVSSITAVPNCAGIPLTHRDHCSSFTVFTGHSDSADPHTALRYEQIAAIPGTKVVLMGQHNLTDWTKSLIEHGVAKTTPVAVIQDGSVAGTLATIAKLAAAADITPPAITIVGDVVTLRDELNWFEHRPLSGRRIVITRRMEQAGSLAARLTELGADVLEVPTIKLGEPLERMALVDALLEINSYEWLIFTSVNGVTSFFTLFFKRFQDLREIGGARIAAVGPATAAKLREYHLQVDLTPEEYTGAKVAEAFEKYQNIENVKMALFRAEVAGCDLPESLMEAGAIVDDIAVYRTEPELEDRTGAGPRLQAEGADWVLFTSSSTVENFHARFDLPALQKKFPQLKIASIGPETSKAIRTLKLEPALEPKLHTTDALVEAVLKAEKTAKKG
jgi:uroporphyrinogen III methyltransferase / synthase